MPTNKPGVVLPELPLGDRLRRIHDDAVASGYTVDTSIDLATLKEAADTLTRPADGDFVTVPREPTRVMLDAAFSVSLDTPDWMRLRYQAMLSAAPQQHGQEVGSSEAMQSFLDPVVRRAIKVAVESAAHYGWSHASWDWESVKGGLDRFGVNDRRKEVQQPADAVYLIKNDFGLWREQTKAEHDWWDGKQNAPARRVLYTTQTPAIDIGKLREGIGSVRNHFEYMKRRYAISTQARVACDDGIAEINELAALIGDGGEVGNG